MAFTGFPIPTAPFATSEFFRQTSPAQFGAVGTANDTVTMQAFLDAGGGYIPAGVYLCDDLTVDNFVRVELHPNAIIRKRAAANANSTMLRFVAGSEGSKWVGGQIDGNRDTHKAAYDLLNPILPAAYLNGWFGVVIEAEYVTFTDCALKNHICYPMMCAGDYAQVHRLDVSDCGSAILFGYRSFSSAGFISRPAGASGIGQSVSAIHYRRSDNNGSNLLQHAFDLFECKSGTYDDLRVIEMGGDLSGVSTFASAITIEACLACQFNDWRVEDFTSDTLIHLAFSFLGNKNCVLTNPIGRGMAGLALELNANEEMNVTNPQLDGEFMATTAVPFGSSTSLGLTYFKGAWDAWRSAKSSIGNKNCQITGGFIRRFTRGGIMRDNSHSMHGVAVYANLLDGIIVDAQTVDSWFPNEADQDLQSSISDCRIFNNGRIGLLVTKADRSRLAGNLIYNNGQDTTQSVDSRAGISLVAGRAFDLLGNTVADEQTFTIADSVSFQPQTGSILTVYMSNSGRIDLGQFIRLVNATGSGDVTAKIIDIGLNDEVTLQAATSVTLSATGNTTALTGTWSGSGLVLTGTGGAADTEITGAVFVTNGSQWRRVRRVTNANSITIDTAFSPALSGATLSVLTVDLAGIPSQSYGLRAFGTALDTFLAPSNTFSGHTVSEILVSTWSNLRIGSEYTRQSVTTPASGTTDLQGQIPASHQLIGVTARVDAAITGNANWTLRLVNGTPATILDIATGILVAKNTKVSATVSYSNNVAGNQALRAIFGSLPGGGPITAQARYRVAAPLTLADLP
jgi:parallel beta-helix repeat protein